MDLELPSFDSSDGFQHSTYSSMKKTYVKMKDGETRFIPKKKFSETIIPYINDAPDIVSKIGNVNYKYDDIEKIVNE